MSKGSIIYNVLFKGVNVNECYVVAFSNYENACAYAEESIKEKGLKCVSTWGSCEFGYPNDFRCIDDKGNDNIYYVIFKQEIH